MYKKRFVIRLFILLFTISISTVSIPYEIINVYGLFGEIKSSTVTKENGALKEQINPIVSIKKFYVKNVNIFNIWLYILTIVIFLIFIIYMLRLPCKDTIITLKVRMDD